MMSRRISATALKNVRPFPIGIPLRSPAFIPGYRFYADTPQPKVAFRRKSRFPKNEETAEEERKHKEYMDAINSGSWIKKYGAIASTQAFEKKMIKWYVLGYAIFVLFGVRYFQKEYLKDKERDELIEKLQTTPEAEQTEYQKLRLKQLERKKLRSSEVAKLKAYQVLRDQHDTSKDGEFDPKPSDITASSEQLSISGNNDKILPPRDLTEFYDDIAPKYDSEIGFEETMSFIGGKRKWLMSQIEGDVLEVACGTGRNIKYLDPKKVNSITFLDTSSKMMEITHEKFKKQFPDFQNVAFVTAKAEKLTDIANTNTRYDTIIETFGLCSHEDPVKALQNMEKLLKPGGRIVLLEHGRGTYDFINRILDNRAHKHSETWGCRWNLDIGEIVDDSGLDIVQEKRHHLGTTWCIVAKRPNDPKRKHEIGILEKYFSKPQPTPESITTKAT